MPQLAAVMAMHTPAGSGPGGTGAHVPSFPGIAQELQLPQDGEAQHSPSVHWLLMHSVPVTQTWPFGLRFVHEPDWQVLPAAQSPLAEQVVRHALGPQRYGAQPDGVCRQLPAPSQVPTGVKVDPLHEAAPQLVARGAFSHAPRPSHFPVSPQGGLRTQRSCGSLEPAGTGWQLPPLPATLQARQLPQLAVEQQTPSRQLPLSQSDPEPHTWPRRFLPQEPALQTLPGAQSASIPQAALQVVPLQA